MPIPNSERREPFLRAVSVAVPVQGIALFEYIAVSNFPKGIQQFEVLPGAETPLEQHDSHEIWSVSVGSGEVFFANTWHALKAGDCVYFQAQQPHRMRNIGSVPMRIFAFWWGDDHGPV